MTEPPITDHTFRVSFTSLPHVIAGRCAFRGTCNLPRADHITAADFRARQRAGGGIGSNSSDGGS